MVIVQWWGSQTTQKKECMCQRLPNMDLSFCCESKCKKYRFQHNKNIQQQPTTKMSPYRSCFDAFDVFLGSLHHFLHQMTMFFTHQRHRHSRLARPCRTPHSMNVRGDFSWKRKIDHGFHMWNVWGFERSRREKQQQKTSVKKNSWKKVQCKHVSKK